MTLSVDLNVHQALRRLHSTQIEPRLAELNQSIAQQLQALTAEEQRLLEKHTLVIAQLQAKLTPDVRCLLTESAFGDHVAGWLANRSRLSHDEPDLSTDLTTWNLHRLPFPVQLVEHQALVDDWAYNDENHYTEYRYELTVQIGSWTTTIGAAIAQLHPGNPMEYHRTDFERQQRELAYQLKPIQRWNEPPAPQFVELNWSIEQEQQLRQELSALFAFVGDLLTLHPLVETFRYPMRRTVA